MSDRKIDLIFNPRPRENLDEMLTLAVKRMLDSMRTGHNPHTKKAYNETWLTLKDGRHVSVSKNGVWSLQSGKYLGTIRQYKDLLSFPYNLR